MAEIGKKGYTTMVNERVLDFYQEKNRFIYEAVSQLAVKVHTYKSKYGKKSIVLTGCGVACGTTMVAINLAVALAQSGHATLLVDADLRTQDKRRSRGTDGGLSDILCGARPKSEVTYPTNIDNLYFISNGWYEGDPALLMCSKAVPEFIAEVSDCYDYIIIDAPAVTVVPESAALFLVVDGIILVCALDKNKKAQLKNAKSIIAPYADKYYGLAVNTVSMRQYHSLFPDYGYYLCKSQGAQNDR